MGVSEEHIPRSIKKIDDLVKGKGHGAGDGINNDSSVEEPDIDREIVHLDDFESLFRVAAPAVPSEK